MALLLENTKQMRVIGYFIQTLLCSCTLSLRACDINSSATIVLATENLLLHQDSILRWYTRKCSKSAKRQLQHIKYARHTFATLAFLAFNVRKNRLKRKEKCCAKALVTSVRSAFRMFPLFETVSGEFYVYFMAKSSAGVNHLECLLYIHQRYLCAIAVKAFIRRETGISDLPV